MTQRLVSTVLSSPMGAAVRPRALVRPHALALAVAALAGGLVATPASAASCTWNTTTGNWNAAVNWLSCTLGNGNPAQTPGPADSATIGSAGVVAVTTGQRIGALSQAGSLVIDSSLRVTGGIIGAGTTTIQNGGLLNLEETQAVGGNATIVFGASGNNRVGIDGGNRVVTLAAGTTIRGGTGTIGLGQLVNGSGNRVINQGLISSDSGGTITLNGLTAGMTNQAILQATGAGSVLQLQDAILNTGGTIRSTAGGVVRQVGMQVTGGTITNSGGGSYQINGSSANVLSGVTLSNGSLIDLTGASSLVRVRDGMTLNGTMTINNNSLANFEGNQTLGGTGSIVLGAIGNNRVGVDGGNKTLTIGSGVTIRGQNGSIGLGQLVNGSNNGVVNNGTIAADVNGGVVSIQGLGAGFSNNGTVRAINGGTVLLLSDYTGGAGGQIAAEAGSRILQQGVTMSGFINTSGTGRLQANGSAGNFLSGATLAGSLDLTNASSLERVVGNLTLNGSVNINNGSLLSFEGDQTLSGSANVVLGAAGNNRVGIDGGNKTLTLAAGTTIQGENGSIGLGQLVNGSGNRLVNNGTISANVNGGVITLQGLGGGITNNSTISALNGGTLQLQSDLTGTASGQLTAGASSRIIQQGVTISGVINTVGSGALQANGSSGNYLSGVTLNGRLDLTNAGSLERVVGNLVLNGTVDVGGGSLINFEGDQTFSGNGTIVFDASGNNRVGIDGGGKVVTLAAGTTIRGGNGTIGLGQLVNGSGNRVINQGLISSDSGGTISLNGLTAGMTNQAILQATGAGSVLQLQDAIHNTGGTIRSTAGGVVRQLGVQVTGGTISNSGGGSYQINGSSSNVLSGVTLSTGSMIDMTSTGALTRVRDGMTLNGTMTIDNTSLANFEGDQTLGGTGSIVFGATGNNRVGVDGGNKTLTIGSGVTIRGQNGSIGLGQLINGSNNGVLNNGTINADGGGTLLVQGVAAGLTNNGLVRAQNGTLGVQTALAGTGTLQVDANGVINLANGAKTQGTLAMGAAGAALNLGTGNLTLNTDYTNAAALTGNDFNRRAGVSGSGQIVAGGNAAQAITGAAVSQGGTGNATLTIGNLRVGANTFNYQVANTGTTGPTLRGAIQTSVNGANISDARLSGGGVAAANYNAGVPGGSSGNLSVVFNATSAGVMAPLTGQVLNLRSGFENIADQKLNIVLAGGATAYNAAVGAATPSPVVMANQRVGGTGTVLLNVSNSAAPGNFSEDLRATFAGSTGNATHNGGSLSALVAGGSNATAMGVGVNTATAGAKAGTVTLNYDTTGTVNGVSNGLTGQGANAPQVINVSGNVYQLAAGALQTAALNFGTLQVGQSVSQSLVVRNTASGAAGFVEDLNAQFGASGNSQISGAGALSGITAGNNSTAANGQMTVTINGAAAGVLNSSIAVNYFSAGAVNGTSNGLGLASVGSEAYGVSGTIQAGANVINQASPLINTPTVNLGAVRMGALSPTGTVSITNAATAAPQAALNASIVAASGPITASGSFDLLNPGATNNSALRVALDTSNAGNFTGAAAGKATISLVSDAINVGNCAPNCQLGLVSQTVNVEGKVYTQAMGQAGTSLINFGIVRVGDTPSARNITINNAAAVTGLNDTLRASLSGLGGPFGSSGAAGGIGAGGSGQIGVTLNTATAGLYSDVGTLAYLSQNADMVDVGAGANEQVQVSATVNNLANAVFNLRGGLGVLTQLANSFVLDFGTVTAGTTVSSRLDVGNRIAGPADMLDGGFDLSGANGLLLSGWNAIDNLLAGGDTADMDLSFLAAGAGLFERSIVLDGFSVNADDPTGLGLQRQLLVRANIVAPGGGGGTVPLPGTLSLVLGALAAAAATRLVRARRSGAVQA